ncbi:MAG TPA: hypothetical protein VMH91_00080 [Candidatus Paceibacterota bacterium]|nr:hypothetical protein [Candidatus Paceibacterota bacterium]
MVIAATVIFFLALIGIVALFTLKRWELARERVLLPSLRERADSEALHLKELLAAGKKDLGNLPPFLLFAAQSIVHGIAVDAGHVAHWLGAQSHRLADSVSHKRNFERGQTRSEFLKKVAEHKNGNGNGDDTTSNV